jgi:hypothetical protein
MGKNLLDNHGQVGGGFLDLKASAGRMMGLGGDGLLGKEIHIPDIKALGMKGDVEDEEEDDEADKEDEQDKEPEKKKWWNKEKAIKDAIHANEQLVHKVTEDAK